MQILKYPRFEQTDQYLDAEGNTFAIQGMLKGRSTLGDMTQLHWDLQEIVQQDRSAYQLVCIKPEEIEIDPDELQTVLKMMESVRYQFHGLNVKPLIHLKGRDKKTYNGQIVHNHVPYERVSSIASDQGEVRGRFYASTREVLTSMQHNRGLLDGITGLEDHEAMQVDVATASDKDILKHFTDFTVQLNRIQRTHRDSNIDESIVHHSKQSSRAVASVVEISPALGQVINFPGTMPHDATVEHCSDTEDASGSILVTHWDTLARAAWLAYHPHFKKPSN